MYNKYDIANALDGIQYGDEPKEIFDRANELGVVIVFGYSDDNMEFRGAIYDEVGCYNGGYAYLNENGFLKNDCGYDCPYFEKLKKQSKKIRSIWCPHDRDMSWSYETDIPHETFLMWERDEIYCEGIVFNLKDAKV